MKAHMLNICLRMVSIVTTSQLKEVVYIDLVRAFPCSFFHTESILMTGYMG